MKGKRRICGWIQKGKGASEATLWAIGFGFYSEFLKIY